MIRPIIDYICARTPRNILYTSVHYRRTCNVASLQHMHNGLHVGKYGPVLVGTTVTENKSSKIAKPTYMSDSTKTAFLHFT